MGSCSLVRRLIGIWLVAIFALFASDRGAEAQTYTLEVGGTSYSVTLLPFGDSFDDNEATLMATPWWGDQSLSEGLAQALLDLGVLGPLLPGSDQVMFAYEETSGGAAVGGAEATDFLAAFRYNEYLQSDGVADVSYATGAVIPVPEIDGNALAKALFILFALGAWLDMRRRRLARGDA